MSTTLDESGLVVVTEAEPQAALDESGLVVLHEALPHHALYESGLIVAFQAEPLHKFFEGGIIIITEEQSPPADDEPVLVQGEEIRRHFTLQGTELDPGPFFPKPD